MVAMRILALDTSSEHGSLAVLEDETVVGLVRWAPGEDHSTKLFRDLQRLLAEVNAQMNDFGLLAVVAGPGSFTGLRVGLTAVKAWSEVHGTPIAAVSGLEALATMSRRETQFLAPVLDARRGQIFAGLYERNVAGLAAMRDDAVLSAAEFLTGSDVQQHRERLSFVTPSPVLIHEHLAAAGFSQNCVEKVEWLLAPAAGRLGLQRARQGRTVDALTLDAHYVRRSDAELTWKEPI
jgi:tRNA threonylcarbamoyladenosine biosynthesis protein TsaB